MNLLALLTRDPRHWTEWLQVAVLAERLAIRMTGRSRSEVRDVLGSGNPRDVLHAWRAAAVDNIDAAFEQMRKDGDW